MADPFSIATGVAGLAGTALSATKGIYEFISTIKEAPEAFDRIKDDLTSIEPILESLATDFSDEVVKDLPEAQRLTLAKAKKPLDNCKVTCTKFKKKLEKIFSRSTKEKKSFRDGVNYWLQKGALADFQIQLEHQKSSLNLAMSFVTLKTLSKSSPEVKSLAQGTQTAATALGLQLVEVRGRLEQTQKVISDFDSIEAYDSDKQEPERQRRADLLAPIQQQEEALTNCSDLIKAVNDGAYKSMGLRFINNEAFDQAVQIMGPIGEVPANLVDMTFEGNKAHGQSTQTMGTMDGASFAALIEKQRLVQMDAIKRAEQAKAPKNGPPGQAEVKAANDERFAALLSQISVHE